MAEAIPGNVEDGAVPGNAEDGASVEVSGMKWERGQPRIQSVSKPKSREAAHWWSVCLVRGDPAFIAITKTVKDKFFTKLLMSFPLLVILGIIISFYNILCVLII